MVAALHGREHRWHPVTAPEGPPVPPALRLSVAFATTALAVASCSAVTGPLSDHLQQRPPAVGPSSAATVPPPALPHRRG